ncbi:MAG: hypothetical protein EXQ52_09755 [Bryobacterales bacterium]|nr:hypothetical protein [Bryobacterales bacterium]
MRLLHFRRTFVEKMFAIHGKVELLKRDGHGPRFKPVFWDFGICCRPLSHMLQDSRWMESG